jgi:hypothetical protein
VTSEGLVRSACGSHLLIGRAERRDSGCRASRFDGAGPRPVSAAFDGAVWPLVFVTNDRSLPIVPRRCWMRRSDWMTGDKSAFACEARPRVADPRRHARRGQLWTRRAGLGLTSSLAEWLRADPATNSDLRACLEPGAIDAVSQPHLVSRAHRPPNAASHAPADAPPYDPADAAPHGYPDRTPAGCEQADPARLADDHRLRAHV